MIKYADWIPNIFAEVFEKSKTSDGDLDMEKYYQARDDFYQVVRGNRIGGVETKKDIEERFSQKPDIDNQEVLCFAAGTAEYYARVLEIDPPKWAKQVPPARKSPIIPISIIVDDFESIIKNTPPELLARNIIYDEHNFTIY